MTVHAMWEDRPAGEIVVGDKFANGREILAIERWRDGKADMVALSCRVPVGSRTEVRRYEYLAWRSLPMQVRTAKQAGR